MATITSLAPETLHGILQCLSPHNLAALAATCKALQPHAESVLYHSFVHTLSRRARERLHQFIHSVSQRSDLARYVKKITIKCETAHQTFHHYEEWELDALDIDLDPIIAVWATMFTYHQFEFGEKYPGHTFRQIRPTGNAAYLYDSLIALLLSKVCNLEVLRMDWGFACHAFSVHQFLKHANCMCMHGTKEHHGFRRLKEVSTNTRGNDKSTGSQGYLRYWPLNIQSLETLEMVPVSTYPRCRKILPMSPPILPNLKRLRLNHTHGKNNQDVSQMLSQSPNLQIFEYHHVQDLLGAIHETFHEGIQNWDWLGFSAHDRSVIDWRELTAALGQIKTTLTCLTIVLDNAVYDEPNWESAGYNEIWQRKGCLGSLRGLTALKRLEVPIFVLLGWYPQTCLNLAQVLPSGLSELCFRDDLVDSDARSDPDSSRPKSFRYHWMPWYHNNGQPTVEVDEFEVIEDIAIGNRITSHQVDQRCRLYCDPSLIIGQIASYLSSDHSLQTLTIKTLAGRSWPKKYVRELASICKQANVVCKFHGRLTNFGEEVRETIIEEVSPLGGSGGYLKEYKYRHRLIEESRGGFYDRIVGVRREGELIAEVQELVDMGWFENFPIGSHRDSGRVVDGNGFSSRDFERNGGWPIGYD